MLSVIVMTFVAVCVAVWLIVVLPTLAVLGWYLLTQMVRPEGTGE